MPDAGPVARIVLLARGPRAGQPRTPTALRQKTALGGRRWLNSSHSARRAWLVTANLRLFLHRAHRGPRERAPWGSHPEGRSARQPRRPAAADGKETPAAALHLDGLGRGGMQGACSRQRPSPTRGPGSPDGAAALQTHRHHSLLKPTPPLPAPLSSSPRLGRPQPILSTHPASLASAAATQAPPLQHQHQQRPRRRQPAGLGEPPK